MSRTSRKESAAPKSTAEWISLAVSLIILLGFLGAIVWLWTNQPTGPAQFKVQRGEVRNETGLFHLPVTVTNTGGLAVGQVRVEGKLNNQGREETTVTTIDFLPVRAQEEVVLIFRSEPSSAVIEVVSYRLP
ncbi:MAG TPA: hypothetical protein VFM05_14460 [Candidatus Saccharimonadales bacterium]|nr:hypothetical protein [Candidatus Saccharimonadales bacterium]